MSLAFNLHRPLCRISLEKNPADGHALARSELPNLSSLRPVPSLIFRDSQ